MPPWETQRRSVRHYRGIERMLERQARAVLRRGIVRDLPLVKTTGE